MRAQLINWLKNDITPAVRQSRKPEQELLKFASAQNLAPAQLEALAQLYNTAATVAYLDKSANRGGNFHIVQVPELLTDYLKVRPEPGTKTADSHANFGGTWENLGPQLNLDILPKCFAGFSGLPIGWGGAPEAEIKIAHAKGLTRAERQEHSQLLVLIDQAKQAAYNLNEDIRGELSEVTRLFRVWEPPAFDQIESDALLQHGDGIKSACDHAAKWLTDANIPVKRASGPGGRRLLRDSPLLVKFAKLRELLDYRSEIQAGIEELEKSAGPAMTPATAEPEVAEAAPTKEQSAFMAMGLSREDAAEAAAEAVAAASRAVTHTSPKATRNTEARALYDRGMKSSPPDALTGEGSWLRDKGPESATNLVKSLSEGMDSWVGPKTLLGDTFKQRFESVINERNNKGQQHLDEGAHNARRQAVLQQLLLTDPVLSEADPEHVISLYNSLAQTMPEVAGDPNVMRMALRSAIQHDGISPFDLKQMTDTETAGQQSGFNREIQKSLKYKGMDLQPPKHRK